MIEKYPNLKQFFGGYFHQDWDIDGSNDLEVVKFYKSTNPKKSIAVVISELEEAIKQCGAGHSNADELLYKLACEYYYQADGLSGLEWMKRILRFLANEQRQE